MPSQWFSAGATSRRNRQIGFLFGVRDFFLVSVIALARDAPRPPSMPRFMEVRPDCGAGDRVARVLECRLAPIGLRFLRALPGSAPGAPVICEKRKLPQSFRLCPRCRLCEFTRLRHTVIFPSVRNQGGHTRVSPSLPFHARLHFSPNLRLNSFGWTILSRFPVFFRRLYSCALGSSLSGQGIWGTMEVCFHVGVRVHVLLPALRLFCPLSLGAISLLGD